MRWPWHHTADIKAKSAKADDQVEQAKAEYEATIQFTARVSSALSFLTYHAEQNRIMESIQKVARGH